MISWLVQHWGMCLISRVQFLLRRWVRIFQEQIILKLDYMEQKTMMKRFFGGSAKNMIASLLNADGLTDDDLEELSAMLQERKGGK